MIGLSVFLIFFLWLLSLDTFWLLRFKYSQFCSYLFMWCWVTNYWTGISTVLPHYPLTINVFIASDLKIPEVCDERSTLNASTEFFTYDFNTTCILILSKNFFLNFLFFVCRCLFKNKYFKRQSTLFISSDSSSVENFFKLTSIVSWFFSISSSLLLIIVLFWIFVFFSESCRIVLKSKTRLHFFPKRWFLYDRFPQIRFLSIRLFKSPIFDQKKHFLGKVTLVPRFSSFRN